MPDPVFPYTKPAETARIVFVEFTEADAKKVLNQSNTATTGGGARDLRFPYKPLESVLARLFPTVKQEPRRGTTGMELKPIRYGTLNYQTASGWAQVDLRVEPPTPSRKSEGRIPTLHSIPPFQHFISQLPAEWKDTYLVVFIQREDGQVDLYFASDAEIRGWHADVATPLLTAVANRKGQKRVVGYIDYERREARL
ncbi:hypothetical protein [Deinococcus aestuarii]|uniref:hypothetical protein n=1 Tax=Deinococcus aestuarii TaxID=2774531 RepID=UPI001C0E476F|nr:hypothetical protein [Deinococcus aestuarii]